MSRYPITWKRKKPKRNSTVTMVWLIAKGKRSKRVKSTAVFRPARVVGITFSLAVVVAIITTTVFVVAAAADSHTSVHCI